MQKIRVASAIDRAGPENEARQPNVGKGYFLKENLGSAFFRLRSRLLDLCAKCCEKQYLHCEL